MAKTKPVRLTREGEARLRDLLAAERKRLEEATRILANLMEEGVSEDDGGLEEAGQEKARLEARIDEIEDILARAELIEGVDTKGGVALGADVTLYNETLKKELKVRVVSAAEAVIRGSDGVARVSEDSPVGRELLGRHPGDQFTVTADNGRTLAYTVKAVSG